MKRIGIPAVLLLAACASPSPSPEAAPPPAAAPAPPPPITLEGLLGIRLPSDPTPWQVRGAADSLDPDLQPGVDLRSRVRIALYERNLRLPSTGPEFQWDLDRVIRLRLASGDADGAERALAEFGDRVGLASWQRANHRANIASARGDMAGYRRIVREMVEDPACPEAERVSGTYWIARTLQREGDLEGAAALLRPLQEIHGESGDARTQTNLGLVRELLLEIERTGR